MPFAFNILDARGDSPALTCHSCACNINKSLHFPNRLFFNLSSICTESSTRQSYGDTKYAKRLHSESASIGRVKPRHLLEMPEALCRGKRCLPEND